MYRPRAATSPQSIFTDKKEVMRIDSSEFVSSVIFTVCESRRSWEFLNTCNYVSSLKYEGDSSIGRLIVCKDEHPNLEIVLKLTTPVQLTEYRKIRKLLEIASRDLSLYSNRLEILGLGKIKGNYDEKNQNLLKINFTGNQKWELVNGCHTMLIVENTNPKLPKLKINKDIFEDLLMRTFSKISSEETEKLWKIVSIATTQKHGALLIISSEAEKEAIRLSEHILKIIANSTSYGIFIEINPTTSKNKEKNEVTVYGMDDFETEVDKFEKPGKSFNPIMSVFLTAGSRLILAAAEKLVTDNGGYIAYCDTDSIFVSPKHVKLVQEFF